MTTEHDLDLDRIADQRAADRLIARRKAARQQQLELYPAPCPTCLSEIGEQCTTLGGTRCKTHVQRRREFEVLGVHRNA